MDNEKLKEILERHRKWLNNEDGGERADLCGANLYGADLCEANLRGANLYGADLCEANLRGADLCGAYLRGAYLYGADLCEANLRGADLCGADLCGAKSIPFVPLVCPEHGSFTAYKKCGKYIIELLIPETAKRSSATTRKCRASCAKVVTITNMDGSQAEVDHVTNCDYAPIEYKIGEYVYPDSYDDDRWNECSHGIHFFINRQEAVEY